MLALFSFPMPVLVLVTLGGFLFLGLVAGIVALGWRLTARPGSSSRSTVTAADLGRRGRRCPNCLSSKVRPSRFRGLEWLLMLVFFRPYRCLSCYHRFWRPGLAIGSEHSPYPLPPATPASLTPASRVPEDNQVR